MSLIAGLILCASLLLVDSQGVGPTVEIQVDAEAETYVLTGPTRSTPAVQAHVIEMISADIDGDGFDDRLVIDDRDSVAGSGIAIFYDVSTGEPFGVYACRLQTPDSQSAAAACRDDYDAISLERALSGIDYLQSATRGDRELDWETRHVAIPNWTAHFADTMTRQSVALARLQYENALASGTDPEPALATLRAALLLREQRADFHPTGE
tara:strand:- start:434 stop:1063 length:630 start_codon:yes stop_codon:yes gene_type:complete